MCITDSNSFWVSSSLNSQALLMQDFDYMQFVLTDRLVPIMLIKLPIMLWSNAPEFYLLCSNYAPYASQHFPQIQHFLFLILLKSQNHEQLSVVYFFQILCNFVFLMSSAHLVIHIRTCTNTLNYFLLRLQLQFDKVLATTDSLKSLNTVKACRFCQ